jgi:uncharacterized repeat protein (TIGR01451 family)
MKRCLIALATAFACTCVSAVEQTVKNDSLTDGANGAIVYGFVANEAAASWLTSPCNGNIRAVQVFWRSPSGTQAQEIHDAVTIYRAGTFPNPGAEAAVIGGPILNDGVINEYRFLDENNTVPLVVPVTSGETFVVSFSFFQAPIAGSGPSVLRDTDGIQAGRNALLTDLGGTLIWFNSATLGLTGDWVIRAVVDCAAGPQNADVAVSMSTNPPLYTAGQPLGYTITVSNAGPSPAATTTIVDIFPAAYTGAAWTCTATGGASCTSGGSGNITQNVSLPSGGQVVYSVTGSVLAGTTGALGNSATAVVGSPATDPNSTNNTATLATSPDAGNDAIFDDNFDP